MELVPPASFAVPWQRLMISGTYPVSATLRLKFSQRTFRSDRGRHAEDIQRLYGNLAVRRSGAERVASDEYSASSRGRVPHTRRSACLTYCLTAKDLSSVYCFRQFTLPYFNTTL